MGVDKSCNMLKNASALARKLLTTRWFKPEIKLGAYCLLSMLFALLLYRALPEYGVFFADLMIATIPLIGVAELIATKLIRPPYATKGLLPTGRSVAPYWGSAVLDPFQDFQIEFDEVEFEGPRGVLRGWFCKPGCRPSEACVICCHGGGRDRRSWLRHLPFLVQAGHRVLLFDYHGAGLSDGSLCLTHGITEHEDVLAAIQFCSDRHPKHP